MNRTLKMTEVAGRSPAAQTRLRDVMERSDQGTFSPRAATVSIVVPTFQEAQNIPELVVRLFSASQSAQLSAELIIVDDNSGDGTVELCEYLAALYPIRLITRTNERGLSTAVIHGLQEATGEYVVVMDADLSHPPLSVPELLIPLQSGTADFVIGSRYVDGGSLDESWSFFRRLNSRVAGLLARGLTRANDPMAGFFAIRRDTLGNLKRLNPCGYKIGLELIVRCDCRRIAEVPIHFEDRKHGASKLNIREQGLYLQHLFRLYAFRYPELFRFATFGAVGVSGMAVDLVSLSILLPLTGLATGRALAIWLAMTWNFAWNRRITFRDASESSVASEYIRFCGACQIGAAISWIMSVGLVALTPVFADHPLAAAMIGTGLAAVVNYAMCRALVFGKRTAIPTPLIIRYPSISSKSFEQSVVTSKAA
ncbi:MAG: glycosyltransferase family 2 protein [Planctomycetaceae bacterium]